MEDRDFRERERHPPQPPLAWRVKELLEGTGPAAEAEVAREPRSETIDLSIVDHKATFGDRDPWAVRWADFSVCDKSCVNQQCKDDVEKEQLVRDSYKHFFELRTPITNAIAVTDVKLPSDRADRLRQLLNEELECDVKEVLAGRDEDGGGIVLRFADVPHSAAFMKCVEGKLASEGKENCSFRADPKVTEEDDLDR